MAEKHQSRQSRTASKETWLQDIKTILQTQRDNPSIATISICLPVGVLVETEEVNTTTVGNISRKKIPRQYLIKPQTSVRKKITGLKYGWSEDFPAAAIVHHMEFVSEAHPRYGKSMQFQLELFPWDGSKFRKTETGVTHTTKNHRGNVVLRQTVASEKALSQVLGKFLDYGAVFLAQHCEIPSTIK